MGSIAGGWARSWAGTRIAGWAGERFQSRAESRAQNKARSRARHQARREARRQNRRQNRRQAGNRGERAQVWSVHSDRPASTSLPTIERLAADLRRIGGIATSVHNDQRVYARAFRLRAIEQAYDDTLLMACRALEVDASGLHSPLGDLDRLRLEAELAQRGLIW